MLIIQKKNILPRFKLVKTVATTPHGARRIKYLKHLEQAIILSLLIIICLTRIKLGLQHSHGRSSLKTASTFEVVNIPELEEEVPPPPIEIEEAIIDEVLIVDEIEVIEDTVEIEINLAFEDLELLEADSQLDDDLSTKATSYRDKILNRSRLALYAETRELPLLDNTPLSLKSEQASYSRDRGGIDEEVDLNISVEEIAPPEEISESPEGSIIEQCNDIDAVILRPPKSSLALKEYRLWHKLSTEMDRIDKGRIGNSFSNITRDKSGLKIHFSFGDGTKHTISWQRGGKTTIMVIGKKRRTSLEELNRALNALLQLTLK